MKVHLLLALLIGACYGDYDVCRMSNGSAGKCVKSGQCKVPDLGNLNVLRTLRMVCQTGEECCDLTDIIQTSSETHDSPITINNYIDISNNNVTINNNYFNFTKFFRGGGGGGFLDSLFGQ